MPLEPQSEQQPDRLANPAAIAPPEERLSLMDVWRVVVKQRFVILAITIISFASAAVYSFRTKQVYESFSRIQINPNSVPKVGLQGYIEDQERGGSDASALQTEMLILQSDSVLLKTAQRMNLMSKLNADRVGGGKTPEPKPEVNLSPVERRGLINVVKGGLSVKVVGGTQMVDIRYRNHDPKLATDIVNTLVDTYIEEDLRSKFDQTKHVSIFLEKQLEDLKQQASDAQIRLANFQKQHNIVGTDENSNLTMQSLSQISGDFETAEADRIVKESRMREFASQDADLAALTGDNQQLTALRTQLAELQTQQSQLGLEVGPRHPRMLALKSQIAKVQASIDKELALARRQIQNEYEGSKRTEEMLHKRLDAQKEEAFRLNEDVGQYAILRHEAELNRDLYDTLQMRLKEAGVTAGLSATNITVVDRAEVPFIPVAPRRTMSMLLGLIGGLVGGIVMAFIIESVDDRMQTSEEVESASTLASLATVPHMEEDPGRRKRGDVEDAGARQTRQLTALHSPKSLAGEAYRGLRSSLLLSSIDKPPRVIVITSAFPGEGKTTTAVNCAIALAQRGERVLLVDADLRRGTLHQVFNINDRSVGLSTVLSRPAVRYEAPAPLPELTMLHVLPTGPRPPNPAEMLSSQRMEEQLRQWTREYDRIVIDSAPVLAVSDTQAMAVLADAVVLVVRAGVTRKRAILRARDLLWRINANIAGVVVNDVDMRLENFYTYRYGMYGYRYGYGYPYAQPYSTTPDEPEDEEKGK
jgi:succinoglycan biosynthesis transport protein ExoP